MRSDRFNYLMSWSAITLLLIFVHIRLLPYAHDDSYIHLRIATHLAQDGAPYFNPGEPIKATSSTVWTVLLALIVFFTGPTALSIAILNALLLATGAQIYTRLLERITGHSLPRLAYSLFFLFYLCLLIVPSAGLMETPLALLILGVSIELLIKRD